MGFEKMYGGGVKSDGSGRNKNDYYPTPPVATYSLVRSDHVPHRVLEPAAGRGWMARELSRCGLDVIASDLFEPDKPALCQVKTGVDFLSVTDLDGRAVVTNPPYMKNLPHRFIQHSLSLGCQYVAMLCRLTFAESHKRLKLFTETPPSRVLVFSTRFNCDEDYFDAGEQLGGMVAYAWWVWDANSSGAGPVMSWIDTKKMMDDWNSEMASDVFSTT